MGMVQKTIRKSAESQSWSQASIHSKKLTEKPIQNTALLTSETLLNYQPPNLLFWEKNVPLYLEPKTQSIKKTHNDQSLFSFTEIMSSLIIKEFKS